METEVKTAKENISLFKGRESDTIEYGMCVTHKQTCQRFLDFLGKSLKEGMKQNQVGNLGVDIQNKITDLENTIKIYEENGI